MTDHRKQCLKLNLEGMQEQLEEALSSFEDGDLDAIEQHLYMIEEGTRLALKSFDEPQGGET
jgi:hypothetical protein